MSTLKVDKLDPQSGTALEIGSSGDTMTVPSGATLSVAGTLGATSGANLTALNATQLTSGAVPKAQMPAGGVVQVVYMEKNDESSAATTSSTWTRVTDGSSNMDYKLQITGVTSGNHVMGFINCVLFYGKDDTAGGGSLCVFREDTVIDRPGSTHSNYHGAHAVNISHYHQTTYQFYDDSPGAATVTYYAGYASYDSATIELRLGTGVGGGGFSMTLMEIQQ